MTAHNKHFPWPSYYGHYRFFEEQMNRHGRVRCLSAEGNGVYRLSRKQGEELRVFVCDCYAFGIAQYIETIDQIGRVDTIIINSAWCGYSLDAKRYCRDENVGLFKLRDFMAALHHVDHWAYLNETEHKVFKEQGWQ